MTKNTIISDHNGLPSGDYQQEINYEARIAIYKKGENKYIKVWMFQSAEDAAHAYVHLLQDRKLYRYTKQQFENSRVLKLKHLAREANRLDVFEKLNHMERDILGEVLSKYAYDPEFISLPDDEYSVCLACTGEHSPGTLNQKIRNQIMPFVDKTTAELLKRLEELDKHFINIKQQTETI